MRFSFLFYFIILFANIVYSDQSILDEENKNKFAVTCGGKHPSRNINHTILFLIDREAKVLKESKYCGRFEDVSIALGDTEDNEFIWYSDSPFIINGYGEKYLNLKDLTFQYRATFRRKFQTDINNAEDSLFSRSSRTWSAQCMIIDWNEAKKLQKDLRC